MAGTGSQDYYLQHGFTIRYYLTLGEEPVPDAGDAVTKSSLVQGRLSVDRGQSRYTGKRPAARLEPLG